MEPNNPLLDDYILQQTEAEDPKICFFPHATSDPNRSVVEFFKAFSPKRCRPQFLSLFAPHTADIESFILEQDIIYVGGGNTRSMLALWREWDLPRILTRACAQGTILSGVSAGANCWFQQCTTDSIPGRLSVLPGLGYLQGSFTPHYDGEAERRPALHRMLTAGEISGGYACDDGAALHLVDGELNTVVISRPAAKAYQLQRDGDQLVETRLPSQFLGAT